MYDPRDILQGAWECGCITLDELREDLASIEEHEFEARSENAWQYIGFHGDDEARIAY